MYMYVTSPDFVTFIAILPHDSNDFIPPICKSPLEMSMLGQPQLMTIEGQLLGQNSRLIDRVCNSIHKSPPPPPGNTHTQTFFDW